MTANAFLSEILVDAPAGARAVIAFGDSITDGDGSTVDGNDRWPDLLAERLSKAGGAPRSPERGHMGAKILADRMGVNALARFDADVLTQPKADTVILMMESTMLVGPAPAGVHDPEPTRKRSSKDTSN